MIVISLKTSLTKWRVGRVVMQRIANPCTPVRFWYPPPFCARVVELVDTRDLKSLAEKRAGSSPAPGTIPQR